MKRSILALLSIITIAFTNPSCEKAGIDDNQFICKIESPSNGSEFEQESIVKLVISSNIDNSQLKDIRFFIDSVLIDSSETSPINFEWNTYGISYGSHHIYAIAIDNNLNSAIDNIELTITENYKPLGEQGQVEDIEGNIYRTIKIGNQWWMAENLRTTKFNDGLDIPIIVEKQDWQDLYSYGLSWYNNEENIYKATDGALYNGYATETEKLCPIGWHIPSSNEWLELESFLIKNGYNYDGTILENKIAKSLADTTAWENSDNEGAIGNNPTKNNSSGFSGRASGSRSPVGSFPSYGYSTIWWSSTPVSGLENHAWTYTLSYSQSRAGTYAGDFKYGFPVRCIKD